MMPLMPTTTPSSRLPAALILTALLLLLAFRLTASETLRDTLTQKSQTIAALASIAPDNPGPLPVIGPTYTAAYATLTFLLAAATAFVAARVHALSRSRLLQLALIAIILALLVISTFLAANRFNALAGTLDIATSLTAAWTILLLIHDRLLGRHARHAIFAAVIAILALGAAKALQQYFDEYPYLAQYLKEHTDEVLRAQGLDNDPAQAALFLARIKSGEVTGFGSFANVFAAQMSALVVLLTALLVAAIPLLKPSPVRPPSSTARANPPPKTVRHLEYKAAHTPLDQRTEIPGPILVGIALVVVLAAALTTLYFTDSVGAIAATLMAVVLLLIGGLFPDRVRAWRKPLLILTALAAIALPAAVIFWGVTHHGLPSKSLLFRWHYWTGTAPIIREHAFWGVGLFNFGDYYLRFKLPISPEDVKDPHNFFMRLAAETGLPATLLIAALLLWLIAAALSRRPPSVPAPDPIDHSPLKPSLILAAVAALAWAALHQLTEIPNEYTVLLALVYAAIAWAIFATALYLLHQLPPRTLGYLALAAVIAALAMFLYDQVNMALVTGPAAMLFWILLALGNAPAAAPESNIENERGRKPKRAVFAAAPLALASAAALALAISLASDKFPWDPAPYEYQYIRDYLSSQNPQLPPAEKSAYLARALDDLDAALARSPNSTELLMHRIGRRRELGQPVAVDIRKILALDRANAAPRVLLALPDSDLPVAERIAILQQALEFNDQLPPDEPKRLTPDQLQLIQQTLTRLRSS
jgi:O-antigen ligase